LTYQLNYLVTNCSQSCYAASFNLKQGLHLSESVGLLGDFSWGGLAD